MIRSLLLITAFIAFTRGQTGNVDCPNSAITDDCDRCSSHDDPHIYTFDGVSYDQHTDGCFKYITTCGNGDVSAPTNDLPFELCGCHYNCGNNPQGGEPCPSNIRCIGNITLTFYDSSGPTFEINVDAFLPTNDAYDTISASSLTSTNWYTFDTLSSHQFVYTKTGSLHEFEVFSAGSGALFYAHIRYSPGNLEVILNEDFFSGNTCGLCGYYNGIQTDDLLNQNGSKIHVVPANLVPFPVGAVINTEINNFANSYLCDESAAIPFDPGCTITSTDRNCVNETTECCEKLWANLVANGLIWSNSIVDEAAFYDQWLIDCASDACALSFNSPDCANLGDEFSFAYNIAKETASAVYTTNNPQTTTFTTTTAFTTTPSPTNGYESNCTAKICAHGDNRIVLDVSYDAGSTWDLSVASENNWKHTMTATINPIDANTVLRFTVKDVSVVGGFLATVQLCGDNGYVFEFYTDQVNTYFDVISDSSGDPLLDVFDAFGSGAWSAFVNEDKVSCMNTNADWMWNDKTLNTMVFELFFGHHMDILEKLECAQDETPAPTMDCCDVFSLDEYLESCYCAADVTPSPTIVGTQATLQTVNQAVNKAYVYKAGGKSVGVNMMEDGVKNVDEMFYKKMNEEMKNIKNMIYVTWMLVIGCFVVRLGLNGDCWYRARGKGTPLKVMDESDEEELNKDEV